MIAFHAVPHRDLMKPEHLREHPGNKQWADALEKALNELKAREKPSKNLKPPETKGAEGAKP